MNFGLWPIKSLNFGLPGCSLRGQKLTSRPPIDLRGHQITAWGTPANWRSVDVRNGSGAAIEASLLVCLVSCREQTLGRSRDRELRAKSRYPS
jgi:hypothetical protein